MNCNHYEKILTKEDRHFIVAEKYDNCVLCLIEAFGPMTQEQVGEYLNITKMRVSQIEKRALRKLEKRIKWFFGKKLFTA